MVKPDAETDSDLIWAAIAGLRADVARLVGRLERIASASEPKGTPEEVAEAWRAERERQIDALLAERGPKGEEIDEDDERELGEAWM